MRFGISGSGLSAGAGEWANSLIVISSLGGALTTQYAVESNHNDSGEAVYRLKLKNLVQGNVLDRSYRSGDKIEAADVEDVPLPSLSPAPWCRYPPKSFDGPG